MISYEFLVRGHPAISCTHRTTMAFTKDSQITPRGDCFIGVEASFSSEEVHAFLREHDMEPMRISFIDKKTRECWESMNTVACGAFRDHKEMVIRVSDYISERSVALRSNKAACDLDADLKRSLGTSDYWMIVRLEIRE